MEAILDFSRPLDVQQFDRVVQCLSTGSTQEIMRAQEILTEFGKKPEAFLRVGELLKNSQNTNTRFFALRILDESILHRWNTFTDEQKQEIRTFLVGLIVAECDSFSSIRSRKVLLTKMNSTLVSVAKREWPVRWPSFIQDVCSSAGPNEPLLENNLNLLRLLGEEVFEFSEKTLTSRWVKRKKEALKNDFRLILHLCMSVVGTTDQVLLKTDLECLEKYLAWMEPSLLFNEEFLVYLSGLVLSPPVSSTVMRCLTVLCSVRRDEGAAGDNQAQILIRVFRMVFNNIVNALPTVHSSIDARVVEMYENGSSNDRDFIITLSQLVISFLKEYSQLIIYDDLLLISTHQMLVGMSYIDEKELFKSCVEYWWWLGEKILRSHVAASSLHNKLDGVLSNVRFVLIKRMVKPEEVVIVEEEGELRREHMSDVEELQLYHLMREALVFLTNINPSDTQQIMIGLMQKQLDRSEWSWRNCSTLSWAVGAVSMAFSVDQERELFTVIIRGLLNLCKEMFGKENRAVIASSIMFVVGQYSRFLRNHPKFFGSVVRKVVEFMKNLFPGVQDMAVDTFMKLASQVPQSFTSCEVQDPCLAQELAENWTEVTLLLQAQQIQTCFAAAGCMIRHEVPERQASLLDAFLQDANIRFKNLAADAAAQKLLFCRDSSKMTEIIHILRIFSCVSSTCGSTFIYQMNVIIWDLHAFYRFFFESQHSLIAELGPNAVRHQDMRYLRLAKKEILRIFERFIDGTEERDFVATNCMPSILTVVLEDYRDALPEAKEPGAMALVAACVNKLGQRLSGDCGAILDHTFYTTVEMITKSVSEYPEFCVNLFKLLQSLNSHCFTAYLSYASTNEDILNGMLWVIKHTDFATMQTGLQTLDRFLENVAKSDLLEPFFRSFMSRIFVEVLVAAMDTLHAAGFVYHCSILMKLFAVSNMFPPETPALGRTAVQAFLLEALSVIPTLTPNLITDFIDSSYKLYEDEERFRRHFADFLIEVQVWGAEEENKLHLEEERRIREETIPGLSSFLKDKAQASVF